MIKCLVAALLVVGAALLVGATDRSYCEAPHPVAVPPDPVTSQLLQVVVLSRHGDRSPLRPFPNEHLDKNVVWNCTFRAPLRAFTTDARTQATTFASVSFHGHTHTHTRTRKHTRCNACVLNE